MIKFPKHIIVAATSWLARLISASVQIVCIRYIIDALGHDGYAVFALLSALLSWTVLFDFGIGNALQNYISEKRAIGEEYHSYIWLSGKICIFFTVVALIVLMPVSHMLAPVYLKSAEHLTVASKWLSFYIALSIFTFTTIGSVIYKIWYAEQKGWLANTVISSSSLCGLFLVYLCSGIPRYNSIEIILIAFFSPQAIMAFCCFIYRLIVARLNLNGKNVVLNKQGFLCRSFGFWGFTAIATVVLQADSIVLSQKISPDKIVIYYIMAKLFGMVGFIYSALLQAIWPECAELRIKRQWKKLNSLVNMYIFFGVVLVATSGFLIFTFKIILLKIISVNLAVDIPPLLFLLFSVYFILRVWSDTYAMLLQSMNILRPLWYVVPFQAIISLGLQWYMADYLGVYGVLFGLILSFLCTVCIYLPWVYKCKVKEMSYVYNN